MPERHLREHPGDGILPDTRTVRPAEQEPHRGGAPPVHRPEGQDWGGGCAVGMGHVSQINQQKQESKGEVIATGDQTETNATAVIVKGLASHRVLSGKGNGEVTFAFAEKRGLDLPMTWTEKKNLEMLT